MGGGVAGGGGRSGGRRVKQGWCVGASAKLVSLDAAIYLRARAQILQLDLACGTVAALEGNHDLAPLLFDLCCEVRGALLDRFHSM